MSVEKRGDEYVTEMDGYCSDLEQISHRKPIDHELAICVIFTETALVSSIMLSVDERSVGLTCQDDQDGTGQ